MEQCCIDNCVALTETMSKCTVCGRRHYSVNAQKGELGVKTSPILEGRMTICLQADGNIKIDCQNLIRNQKSLLFVLDEARKILEKGV